MAFGLINLGGIRGFSGSFVTVLTDLGHLACEEWRLACAVNKLYAAQRYSSLENLLRLRVAKGTLDLLW